jgi:hypothetical protein
MSYALLLIDSTVARSALLSFGRSSSSGTVNGWWVATNRFSSSSYSNAGKFTTHTQANSVLGVMFRSRAIFSRSSPSTLWTTFGLSATKQSRSPCLAPVRDTIGSAIDATNFATPVYRCSGLPAASLPAANAPVFCASSTDGTILSATACWRLITFVTATPLPPYPLLHSASASVSLRVICPPPGTTMHLTIGAFLNTPNSVVCARSVMSCSCIPNRKVGAVGPVPAHRLVVVDVRDRAGDLLAEHVLPDPPEQALHHPDDVVPVDERHLDVELGELGLAVGPRVLVAEAPDDLHVLVAPADHQQLLEQLRRLRQGVEAARLQPAGDDEVPRALRRALGQERRLDLPEPEVAEVVPHDLRRAVPDPERLLHLVPAEVEVAVLEPPLLVHRLVLVRRRTAAVGELLSTSSA